MKKYIYTILTILILSLNINYSNAFFFNDYYYESIKWFINSPDKDDLKYIKDERTQYCEEVYLEATRRRDYTDIEVVICSDIFTIKRQQELDYKVFMLKNRWIEVYNYIKNFWKKDEWDN